MYNNFDGYPICKDCKDYEKCKGKPGFIISGTCDEFNRVRTSQEEEENNMETVTIVNPEVAQPEAVKPEEVKLKEDKVYTLRISKKDLEIPVDGTKLDHDIKLCDDVFRKLIKHKYHTVVISNKLKPLFIMGTSQNANLIKTLDEPLNGAYEYCHGTINGGYEVKIIVEPSKERIIKLAKIMINVFWTLESIATGIAIAILLLWFKDTVGLMGLEYKFFDKIQYKRILC